MKPREYCCCAIPLVNAGIYSVLSEQFVCGVVVGIVSMATDSIVGAATPSFAPYFLGVVALVAAGVQENTSAFKKYLTLHTIITIVAFAIAAAWIIISASRHSTAKANCLTNYFANADSSQINR
ncbi:hypothetical protein FISHEDRAFT_71637 [Fistulina hepatica ATCC 64428]|uniref:Uncharacterized protein n=1 Tax=Fistulina hepatica ATCC 64428 TaxID=1128425 RepID=A0A0D7AIC7_9AGAR|nr:hypothetical protein FISHEDRAFT_71637 [Fistulina hepatica ATCC 64428]